MVFLVLKLVIFLAWFARKDESKPPGGIFRNSDMRLQMEGKWEMVVPWVNLRCMDCGIWDIKVMPYSTLNSLSPGRFGSNLKWMIFTFVILLTWTLKHTRKIALSWMPQSPVDSMSTLQMMVWCCQATNSHYLSQCWLTCVPPFWITMLQWVATYWSVLRKQKSYIFRIFLLVTFCDGTFWPQMLLQNRRIFEIY